MVIVVVINLALALILVYVAWHVWRLRLQLAAIADILSIYERNIHAGLTIAPKAIAISQLGIHQLRQPPLQALELLRLAQVLTLLSLGQQIWQQSRLGRRSKFLRKALAKYK